MSAIPPVAYPTPIFYLEENELTRSGHYVLFLVQSTWFIPFINSLRDIIFAHIGSSPEKKIIKKLYCESQSNWERERESRYNSVLEQIRISAQAEYEDKSDITKCDIEELIAARVLEGEKSLLFEEIAQRRHTPLTQAAVDDCYANLRLKDISGTFVKKRWKEVFLCDHYESDTQLPKDQIRTAMHDATDTSLLTLCLEEGSHSHLGAFAVKVFEHLNRQAQRIQSSALSDEHCIVRMNALVDCYAQLSSLLVESLKLRSLTNRETDIPINISPDHVFTSVSQEVSLYNETQSINLEPEMFEIVNTYSLGIITALKLLQQSTAMFMALNAQSTEQARVQNFSRILQTAAIAIDSILERIR